VQLNRSGAAAAAVLSRLCGLFFFVLIHREEIKCSKSWLTVAVKTASAREGKEHK